MAEAKVAVGSQVVELAAVMEVVVTAVASVVA